MSDWSSDVCSSDLTRANDAVDARCHREFGEVQHLLAWCAIAADRLEIAVVEAGQRRHRDHLGAKRRAGLGVLEHLAADGGMDGEKGRLERKQQLERLADGFGDIVELANEESR